MTTIATYTLRKTALKNGKFLYEFIDDNGTVYGTRTSWSAIYMGAMLITKEGEALKPSTEPLPWLFGRADLMAKKSMERFKHESKQPSGTKYDHHLATI